MRKTRSGALRTLAYAMYDAEFPNFTPRRIYRQLKKNWYRFKNTKKG